MPLDQQLLARCPYFHGLDRLRLHPDFKLQGNELIDVPIWVTQNLHESGIQLTLALRSGIRYEELCNYADSIHVSHGPLTEYLGLLNSIGALCREKSIRQWPVRAYHLSVNGLLGVRYDPLLYRSTNRSKDLLLNIVLVSKPVLVASILVWIMAAASGLYPLGVATVVWAYSLSLFIVSMFAHEKAHLHLLNKYGQSSIVLRGFLRLGIVHKKMGHRQELNVAIIGPAAGICVAMFAVLANILLAEELLALVGCIVATLHLLSFVPWYGDGKTIKQLVRSN